MNHAVQQRLTDCILACNHCFDTCLNEEPAGQMADCIRLDRECADICSLLLQAITRNSSNVAVLAKACQEICEACAAECSKHDHDHCQACAKACTECAEACRQLI